MDSRRVATLPHTRPHGAIMKRCRLCDYEPSPMWRREECPHCGASFVAPQQPDPDPEEFFLPFPPLTDHRPIIQRANVGTFLEIDVAVGKPVVASLCYGNPESTEPSMRLEVFKTATASTTSDSTPQARASEQQATDSPAGTLEKNRSQLRFSVA